jgi:precorrin-6B methylase 2
MLKRYVDNWLTVMMIYSGIKKQATVVFKDGSAVHLTKQQYHAFKEKLYRMHLQNNGFSYSTDERGRTIIRTPDDLLLILPAYPVAYSFVFDEIYLQHVYGKPDLTDKIVIDIGASIGDTTLFFCKQGASHIYAFEKNIERSRIAKENILLNGLQDKVTLVEEAANANQINEMDPDFIKIDCEGCEYELLPKLVLSRVSNVVMEYHHESEPLLQALKGHGFKTKRQGEIIIATRDLKRAIKRT